MSELGYPKRRRGIAGVAFVLFVALTLIGATLDFAHPAPAFWIVATPGGRALVGAGAAAFAVLAAHVLRLAFGRKLQGRSDARDQL